jgi:hypothetical protein
MNPTPIPAGVCFNLVVLHSHKVSIISKTANNSLAIGGALLQQLFQVQ